MEIWELIKISNQNKKFNGWAQKSQFMGSVEEYKIQRKKAVKLKIEKWKLCSMNNRKKVNWKYFQFQ